MGKRFTRPFTEETTHVANNYLKRYSKSLVIQEMQTETIKIQHFIPIRLAQNKRWWRGRNNRWSISGGSVVSITTLQTSLSFSYKMEYLHSLWSNNSTPMYLSQINFHMHSRDKKGHSSIAYGPKSLETIQVSISKVKKYITCNEMNPL